MPTVLITGASRGIGRATALRLAAGPWQVVAGVRRAQDGEALAAEGAGAITPVVLDVTDAELIAALPDAVPGGLDAVVNNAGVVVPGPVEALALDDLRRQLEVNVVGQVAVTQAVLPRLRESRGRIVFVSSLNGRVSTPMTGAYNASKFALEALADTMRLELRPWSIRVVLVEPAAIDTDIWRGAEDTLESAAAGLEPRHRELYAKHIAGYRKAIPRFRKTAAPVEAVAATIERALTDARPRARYVPGAGPRVQAALAHLTPAPALDAVLGLGTGMPRRP
jgi:NAD(P)-dependent dehydrogenase (short-subunit alcohol dehydrogenase family)